MPLDLRESAATFAHEVQETLEGVLPGEFQIVSIAHGDRYVVRPAAEERSNQHIPLYVGGAQLATLGIQIYLGLDRTGRYLKAWRSDISVLSAIDRTPLVRQEFDAKLSDKVPLSHWQVHAERGALSHILGRANAARPSVVRRPHDMSSLHFPVGGERFRPCLEDVLDFTVRELGVDHQPGWTTAIGAGRERWRRKQLRSTVRDLQEEAADVLRGAGWSVEPPREISTESDSVLHRW